MQLYFSGESLRNTAESVKLIGMDVSHQTVYSWIKKYVTLMARYLEQIKPNVSDAWRADELYLKIRGDAKYLFALMDDQTCFWIAQQVADTKYTSNIQPLFKDAKIITGKRPNTVITDGAANFHDAFKKEFFTINSPRTRHISQIRLQGDHNNNKMERLNGEVRDRDKVMRGLKRADTRILPGHQIYQVLVYEYRISLRAAMIYAVLDDSLSLVSLVTSNFLFLILYLSFFLLLHTSCTT